MPKPLWIRTLLFTIIASFIFTSPVMAGKKDKDSKKKDEGEVVAIATRKTSILRRPGVIVEDVKRTPPPKRVGAFSTAGPVGVGGKRASEGTSDGVTTFSGFFRKFSPMSQKHTVDKKDL